MFLIANDDAEKIVRKARVKIEKELLQQVKTIAASDMTTLIRTNKALSKLVHEAVELLSSQNTLNHSDEEAYKIIGRSALIKLSSLAYNSKN